jgi:hypothetical protein
VRFVAVAFVALVLAGCNKDSPPTLTGGQNSLGDGWTFEHSHNVKIQKDAAGRYYFDFPSKDGAHYLTRKAAGLKPGMQLHLHYTITGGCEFVPSDKDDRPPTHVKLYFQKKGDNLSDPNGRWWTHARNELVAGEYMLMIDLNPSLWHNVNGENGVKHPAEFYSALNAGRVGATFGGDWFSGHGAFCRTGQARFTIISFGALK